jgi:membrane protease YdiL (CAAX protease family)
LHRNAVYVPVKSIDFPSTHPNSDPFIRQARVGRIGLLAMLGAFGLGEGSLWIAKFLADAVLPQDLRYPDSLLGFIVRFCILDALNLTGIFLAVRLILRRPLRTVVTDGRPVSRRWLLQGVLLAICLHVPGYIGLLWAQPVDLGRWFDIVQAGIGPRMFVLFGSMLLLYPFQTLGEELVFRGFLTQLLGDSLRSRIVVAVVVALVFTLVHGRFGAAELADLFAISLFLSAVTFASGGIEWAVGYHATVNILVSWSAYLLSALPADQWRWIDEFLWGHAALHATMAGLIFWRYGRATRRTSRVQRFP